MSVLNRLASCLLPCSGIKSEGNGMWTGNGLHVGACPVTPTELSLPQDDGCVKKAARSAQSYANRTCYQIGKTEGFDAPWASMVTAMISTPPTFSIGQIWLQLRARYEQWTTQQLEDDGQIRFSSFDEFNQLFVGFDVPKIHSEWRSDQKWCDQFVTGVGPYTINRVGATDADNGADWPTLKAKLSPDALVAITAQLGCDVADAMEQRRLFVADFWDLKDAGPTPGAPGAQSGQVPMAPIALLARIGDAEGLSPIGVQMDQTPEAAFQIADGSDNWLYAKVFVQAACYQVATLVHHVAWHHMVAEALSVVTLRRLTQFHPLFGLLVHHVAATSGTNLGVRTFFFGKAMGEHMLTGKDGGYRLANAGYNRFHYDRLDFIGDMQRRGVDDPSVLPYYPVRDDGLLYWKLVGEYVHDYLAIFYGKPDELTTNSAIAGDAELQAWVRALSREAGGEGNLAGFPASVETFEELHQLVHRIVFWVGPSHATLNFSALLDALWLPNMPGATYQSPPADEIDSDYVVNSLPPLAAGAVQVEILQEAAFWFASFLDYEDYFCGSGKNGQAHKLVAATRSKLKTDIEAEITTRNEHRVANGNLPYTLLMPGEVPNSLSA